MDRDIEEAIKRNENGTCGDTFPWEEGDCCRWTLTAETMCEKCKPAYKRYIWRMHQHRMNLTYDKIQASLQWRPSMRRNRYVRYAAKLVEGREPYAVEWNGEGELQILAGIVDPPPERMEEVPQEEEDDLIIVYEDLIKERIEEVEVKHGELRILPLESYPPNHLEGWDPQAGIPEVAAEVEILEEGTEAERYRIAQKERPGTKKFIQDLIREMPDVALYRSSNPRGRRSKEEMKFLTRIYRYSPYTSPASWVLIARHMRLDKMTVHNWFNNERRKEASFVKMNEKHSN